MKTMISLGLKHEDEKLWVLDQQKLPHEEVWVHAETIQDMVGLIRRLAVRGAPLIGVAASLALGKLAETSTSIDELIRAAQELREARPTAVNLMWAVDRLVLGRPRAKLSFDSVVKEAETVFDEDVALCRAMGRHGAALIDDGDNVLTHCNTGGLATAGIGTALGVIRTAHEQGKRLHVFVDETRPLLQGARLTAWELKKLGVPYTLITDNMAAWLMKQGRIQKVFTGADRIAVNGDSANKIGTYGVAVMAKYHEVPFYVVAPYSTLDANCATGDAIPIEQREPNEVRLGFSPSDSPVYNPAFDVTPHELITALVLDNGIRPLG